KNFGVQQVINRITGISTMYGGFWEMLSNFVLNRRVTKLLVDLAVQIAFQSIQPLFLLKGFSRQLAKGCLRSVAENNAQFQCMFSGGAINDRGGSTGVVTDHSPDHRTVSGRSNGAKKETIRL